MQDCSHGLKDVVYDLGDCTKWEFMFPSNEKPVLQMSQSGEQLADMADEEEFEEVEKFIDMPHSWSQPLQITRKEFQLRCPHGKKTVLYKRAKLEKYTPYLLSDGMVAKLYIYKDDEMHSLSITREFYENRIDHLERRQHNMDTGFVTEYFKKGKKNALREHYYKVRSQGPESERTMIFDSHMRVDGLVRREELATEMTEHYVESTDFLVYKHTKFGKRVKIFGPSSKSARPISCIEEKFKRNPERSVSTNLALREFDIASDTIRLTYHHEPDCVTAATQEFIKPPNLDEKRDGTVNLFEYLSSYQPDPHTPKPTNLQLYQQLDSLIKEEWKAQARVIEILNERRREEARTELDISIYDVERNEKARKQRLAQVQQEKEDKNREREMDTDYLAPFLTRFSSSEGALKRSQALRVKDECLQDLKQRLIDKANLIQSRFEQETNELQKKQQWYQQCQTSMSKEDEEEYLSYCSASMFRIHILEHRLNKHKELAPQRYMALEQKLRNDARLADLL
ncbi:PREDICTED: dynein regulatory complex subunit 7-like [Priapulus caudatus]|uniref:Dynein regulatory complex subunit 7-like n=1 Tax=Priapulus caudatus TaxID=37621 RepID=A0ABM1EQV9_PRICU|nr:PREDICTED: dynein regulatory complex subunit 7-like [Priapulus caudatus]